MILDQDGFGIWSWMMKRTTAKTGYYEFIPSKEFIIPDNLESELPVYIHFPFCRTSCIYCPYTRQRLNDPSLIPKYLKALCSEIRLYGKLLADLNPRLVDVHIGGGTPSLLDGTQLSQIRETLAQHFDLKCSFAIEANPNDLSGESKAFQLVEAGVNEVSLGVQSFNPAMLKRLGRAHSVEQAIASIQNMRDAGVDRINIDLMYMIPAIKPEDPQTVPEWSTDLEQASRQDVDEITCYPTIISPKSLGYRFVTQRKLVQPTKSEFKRMIYLAEDILSSAGFIPVEIYGYSKIPNWKYATVNYPMEGSLLGMGAGAIGTLGFTSGFKYINLTSPIEYIQRANQFKLPFMGIRDLGLRERVISYTMCRLFICRRLDFVEFKRRFKAEFGELIGGFGRFLGLLKLFGRIKRTAQGLELTRKGLFTAHMVSWAYVANSPVTLVAKYSEKLH